MKTKKQVRKKIDPMLQIAKYIESHGWKVIVIGPALIEQDFCAPKFNYRFVVKFTGTKKKK